MEPAAEEVAGGEIEANAPTGDFNSRVGAFTEMGKTEGKAGLE